MSTMAGGGAAPEKLFRIAARSPADVCARLELGEEAVELLADQPAPTGFLTALLQGEHYMDAVHYMANAFEPRDAASIYRGNKMRAGNMRHWSGGLRGMRY